MNILKRASLTALVVFPVTGFGQEEVQVDEVNEIVVIGRSVETSSVRIMVERELLVDTASVLKDIPGANVNTNGLITGIVQYRGMYGDRIAVDIDELGVTSGGPNAMDTPLSYMSPMITEELVVARGIASVTLAPESIGGYVSTKLARGEFATGDFAISGLLGTRYANNGNLTTSAGRLTLSNQQHRFSMVSEIDAGNSISTPEGKIRPSGLSRQRYDISYAHAGMNGHLMLYAGKLDTDNTGTPALPMDIILIDTTMAGTQFGFNVAPGFTVQGTFAHNDVDHVMDNHTLRLPPMPPMFRLNTVSGRGSHFSMTGTIDRGGSNLELGIDGVVEEHDSVITNPANAGFQVDNFSAAERDLVGIFAAWFPRLTRGEVELGLRFNRVETDAGDVSATGMMGMMGTNVGMLADAFNRAERQLSWSTLDAVLKYRHFTSGETEWMLELGSKSRAPSYQELYLWLPLQTTGGLADGRTYIGNLDLRAERSTEFVIGLTTSDGRLAFSPQAYIRSVDDYIQGVPAKNALANQVSVMMTGVPPLQFENVAARIWGFDAAWRYELGDALLLDGVISIARGRRTDADDDLYRISPYNASLGLTYSAAGWTIKSELVGYLDQKHVSAFNGENETAGYWLVNLALDWSPLASLRVEARVDNLLDESYQDHLADVNRTGGSGFARGMRILGAERTLSAGLIYEF